MAHLALQQGPCQCDHGLGSCAIKCPCCSGHNSPRVSQKQKAMSPKTKVKLQVASGIPGCDDRPAGIIQKAPFPGLSTSEDSCCPNTIPLVNLPALYPQRSPFGREDPLSVPQIRGVSFQVSRAEAPCPVAWHVDEWVLASGQRLSHHQGPQELYDPEL